ncbi:sigma-70 family RNA polymerase sigma factor [Catellatospora citrea]|uniref:sigma-70 family RNA polymerase sigma factor n=1 Tax=Catellatospora citrea TaxID=53366 RepID=UPI0033C9F980
MQATLIESATFASVYSQEYTGLVRLAYMTTGNVGAAEDVVQEVFAAWYRQGAHVHQPAAYLRRAVISRCTSWVRRRVLERRHASVFADGHEPAYADVTAVRAALRRLRPRQRAAVFLRYYLDLPESEIAEALGCRLGTVKSLLHRSLATMKEFLGE